MRSKARIGASRLLVAIAVACAGFVLYTGPSSADTIMVRSTADSDTGGTLREAIRLADADPSLTVIKFAFEGTVPPAPVIRLSSELVVHSLVEIDGTQNGDSSRPGVQLIDAADTSTPIAALRLADGSAGSQVHHLSITGSGATQFDPAIALDSSLAQVHDNWIGVDLAGNGAPNVTGVQVNGSNNQVGPRNVISFNTGDGVAIPGASAGDNTVFGNYVGVGPSGKTVFDTSGTAMTGNIGSGVYIGVSPGGNTVGGSNPSARNIIANNGFSGVYIDSTGGNTVLNNLIGLDLGGTVSPNDRGVFIDNSPDNRVGAAGQGNVIVGNFGDGIQVIADRTTIEGNFIGVDAAGTSTNLGNQSYGIEIGGSGSLVQGNVVADNEGTGVRADDAVDLHIVANSIGVNAAGQAHPNLQDGIFLNGGSGLTVQGNVVAGNQGEGIHAELSEGVTIQGNRIGVNRADVKVPNFGNGVLLEGTATVQIGGAVTPSQFGTASDVGNVISGNGGTGVALTCIVPGESSSCIPSDATTIQGNRIGTNSTGMTALGNATGGIGVFSATGTMIGGDNPSLGNIVSGNGDGESLPTGIEDQGTGDTIRNNLIGTDAAGGDLGNGGSGIVVGSIAPDILDNTIAYNGGNGVEIVAGLSNPILGNRIHDNRQLGIDLVDPLGPNPIDTPESAAAPNRNQHYPVLTSATRSGSGLVVSGSLASLPLNQFTIEVFASRAGDPSGFGEGETPLGRFPVTTDSSGRATFTNQAIPAPPGGQTVITATATDRDNNTSEFSRWIPSLAAATLTTQASPSVTLGGSITDTATLTGATNPTGTLTFSAYGPNNATCAAPAVFASTVPLPTGGTQVTSATFTPAAPGVYRWVATYSGDSLNGPAGPTACGDPAEQVIVRAIPTIATTASPVATLTNNPVHDTATVAGGFAPTGTVTFILYTDAACSVPVFSSPNQPLVNGSATSTNFTPTALGVYRWIATYSGDANNAPVSGVCGAPNETVAVGPAPTTTTTATIPPSTLPPTSTSTTATVPRTTTTTQPPDNGPPDNGPPDTNPPDTTTTTATTTTVPTTTTVTTATTVAPTTTPATTAPATTAPGTTVAPVVTPATTPAATTPTATTAATTATTVPAAATTVPPATTTIPAPTTTGPTSSTTPPSSTTSTVPPTTVPPPPASVDAVNADGGRSGPPGVGLTVTGAGYQSCGNVYIHFDGVRIGTDKPDAAGVIHAGGLSVPGDAGTGAHQISASCNPSGSSPRATTAFTVTAASVHRPALVTAVPLPGQVSLDLGRLGFSAAVAIAVLILFAFPFELFNSTVEENYDEIRGWFRLPARAVEAGSNASRTATFLGLTVITAIVVGFLSPGFGLNMTSVVSVLGFSAALLIMSVGFSLPAAFSIHRRSGEWGRLNFLPGTVLVSIVMVALSRLLHWQPGYMYGALAGLAFASALTREDEGRITASNWVFALIISVGAFFLRAPVATAAAKPGASVWWIGVEAALVLIFLWGIEGLAVAMLPMRFLDGRKVIDWNRVAWAVLMFLGLFSTIHILLTPSSGYVGHTTGQVTVGVVILFLIFGAISVGLWSYFRYRPARWNPNRAQAAEDNFHL